MQKIRQVTILILSSYRLFKTARTLSTPISRTSEDTQKSQRPRKRTPLPLKRKLQPMEKKPVLRQVAQQDPSTLKESLSLSIRVKDWTLREDQETSTTLLARSSSTWLNNHITITFTETKANSTLSSKSIRLKCANTSLREATAHFNSIASSPMALPSSDSQMT